ncbi:MAG TPA: hypothetical protein VGB70_08115 [Allosphingosinicella sp.]|jgi:hypothetical protein
MDDQDQPPPAPPEEEGAPLPWEGDPPPEETHDEHGRRVRHDAFTARRKHEFLRALVKLGTVEDAARKVGVDPRTVYRHQEKDPEFLGHCRLALRMMAVPIELTAWQRAVEGVEQEFACGGEVHVRRRYDAGLLRLFLQASNPKKFGPRPGFTRKRLTKYERKQMLRDVRAENQLQLPRLEDVHESIRRKVAAITKHRTARMLEEGWVKHEGHWIPPGWGPLPGYEPQPEGSPGELHGEDDIEGQAGWNDAHVVEEDPPETL